MLFEYLLNNRWVGRLNKQNCGERQHVLYQTFWNLCAIFSQGVKILVGVVKGKKSKVCIKIGNEGLNEK
jgi:hypothetical protein